MVQLQADATTWVFRRGDGEMEAVKVTAMTDSHLFRWIRYFRKKWRDNGHTNVPDAQLDTLIKLAIVTAPAIYAEAVKRGVYVVSPTVTVSLPSDPEASPALVPGARRIDLNEE